MWFILDHAWYIPPKLNSPSLLRQFPYFKDVRLAVLSHFALLGVFVVVVVVFAFIKALGYSIGQVYCIEKSFLKRFKSINTKGNILKKILEL